MKFMKYSKFNFGNLQSYRDNWNFWARNTELLKEQLGMDGIVVDSEGRSGGLVLI